MLGQSSEDRQRIATAAALYNISIRILEAGLWIRIRIRSGFIDFVNPDPWASKMKKKMHFSLTFSTFFF
jgi:hypothetical protein